MYAWVEWTGGEDVGKHSVIPRICGRGVGAQQRQCLYRGVAGGENPTERWMEDVFRKSSRRCR